MCHCLLSTRIEAELFIHGVPNKTEIPDEACPICLESLRTNSSASCCGGYAKQLHCGHYVHVSCQINNNTDLIRCSLCRKQLTNTILYYNICKSLMMNKLPFGYKRAFLDNTLTEQMSLSIERCGIDIAKQRRALGYLDSIKNNEQEMFDFFKSVWQAQ